MLHLLHCKIQKLFMGSICECDARENLKSHSFGTGDKYSSCFVRNESYFKWLTWKCRGEITARHGFLPGYIWNMKVTQPGYLAQYPQCHISNVNIFALVMPWQGFNGFDLPPFTFLESMVSGLHKRLMGLAILHIYKGNKNHKCQPLKKNWCMSFVFVRKL